MDQNLLRITPIGLEYPHQRSALDNARLAPVDSDVAISEEIGRAAYLNHAGSRDSFSWHVSFGLCYKPVAWFGIFALSALGYLAILCEVKP